MLDHETDLTDSASTDEALMGNGGENTNREAPADSRIRRIMDYLQVSLEREDALQANLNAANADLMMIGYRLASAIKANMASSPASLDSYVEFMPALNNLLRLNKQVDRFSTLDDRLSKAKESSASKAQSSGIGVQSEEL